MSYKTGLAAKVLYGTLTVAAASAATVLAWNYSLLGIFPMLPALKVGNVFVIYVAAYFVKVVFTNPVLFDIQEKLSAIDTNMKNIHHSETEQRKALMGAITHIENNMRIVHGNDVAQRKGIMELLTIISNKLKGKKTETTHDVID